MTSLGWLRRRWLPRRAPEEGGEAHFEAAGAVAEGAHTLLPMDVASADADDASQPDNPGRAGAGPGDEESVVPPASEEVPASPRSLPASLAWRVPAALAVLSASAALCVGVDVWRQSSGGARPQSSAPKVTLGKGYPHAETTRAPPDMLATVAYTAAGLELPILTNGDFSTGDDASHNRVDVSVGGSLVFDLGGIHNVTSVSIAGGNAKSGGTETPNTIDIYTASSLNGPWVKSQTIRYRTKALVDSVVNAQRKDFSLDLMRTRFVKLQFLDSHGNDDVAVRQVAFAGGGDAAGLSGSATTTASVYEDSGDDDRKDEDEEDEEDTSVTNTTAVSVTTAASVIDVNASVNTGSTSSSPSSSSSSSTFYCFTLMMPDTDEESLVLWQAIEGVSLFACDEAAVYSNMSRELVPGVTTLKVDSNLSCDKGGEFGTALNAEIFFAVWDAVIASGRYREHDWSVKVDPDCVFFPHRMHDLLDLLVDEGGNKTGVYINNCQYGMHGPLEVLSVAAVDTWDRGRQDCVDHFEELCDGPCLWGEDMFLDQCLQMLNSTRIDDFNQLLEDHCSPPDGWQECANGSAVAFHPYKNVSAYERCFNSSFEAAGDDWTSLMIAG